MGGGKGDSKTRNEIRYAPYLEDAHKLFLDIVETNVATAIAASPYALFTDWDAEDGFFGAGLVLSSFPSLFDMYGKFMAGLDVEVLFNEAFEDTVNGTVVENMISAEADRLSDEIEFEVGPRFEAGMRDINSVMSSQFVVGRSLMEGNRLKAISRFSAEVKMRLIPVVTERWKAHLGWNKEVIEMYAQVFKLYISQRMDIENHNYEMHSKDVLWPFNAIQYETAALGAMGGATNTTSTAAGASTAQKAIGGAMMGAATGGAIAGPPGAVIGGLIGLASGFL